MTDSKDPILGELESALTTKSQRYMEASSQKCDNLIDRVQDLACLRRLARLVSQRKAELVEKESEEWDRLGHLPEGDYVSVLSRVISEMSDYPTPKQIQRLRGMGCDAYREREKELGLDKPQDKASLPDTPWTLKKDAQGDWVVEDADGTTVLWGDQGLWKQPMLRRIVFAVNNAAKPSMPHCDCHYSGEWFLSENPLDIVTDEEAEVMLKHRFNCEGGDEPQRRLHVRVLKKDRHRLLATRRTLLEWMRENAKCYPGITPDPKCSILKQHLHHFDKRNAILDAVKGEK